MPLSVVSSPRLRTHLRQTASFVVCGLLGAAIEFAIIYVLVGRLHWSPFIVYIPSALIPAVFVFFFNKYLTFRAGEGKTAAQTKRFLVVYVPTFILNYLLSSGFYILGNHFLVGRTVAAVTVTHDHVVNMAKACAIGIVAIVNYILSHTFIFRDVPTEAEVMGVF